MKAPAIEAKQAPVSDILITALVFIIVILITVIVVRRRAASRRRFEEDAARSRPRDPFAPEEHRRSSGDDHGRT